MGSFKRALLGYRRGPVDEAIAGCSERIDELERELSYLAGVVLDKDREIRDLHQELRDASQRHDESLRSLEAISRRLEEMQAQARGQATRIRMKALSEAVEVTRRVQELAQRAGLDPATLNGATEVLEAAMNGHGQRDIAELFEGLVKVEIGPLGDFSQLVGFEDAAGQIGATSEISVEKFSEGRATISLRLDEPVELLRELEERAPFEFKVRHTGGDRLVLDVDEDDAQAA
jgi:hypothetical protein